MIGSEDKKIKKAQRTRVRENQVRENKLREQSVKKLRKPG